jgi:hypothetical protein
MGSSAALVAGGHNDGNMERWVETREFGDLLPRDIGVVD